MKARNVQAKFGSPYGRPGLDRSRPVRPEPKNPAPIPKLQPYRGCTCGLCSGAWKMDKGSREAFFRTLNSRAWFFSPDVKELKAPPDMPKPDMEKFVSARPWMYFIGGPLDGDRKCIPYPSNGQGWVWSEKMQDGLSGWFKTHKYVFHEIFLPGFFNSRWIALHESLSLGNPGLMPSILAYLSPLPPSLDDDDPT